MKLVVAATGIVLLVLAALLVAVGVMIGKYC